MIKLAGRLSVGDTIRIDGAAGQFTQAVESLQIESVDVRSGNRGQLVGMKVCQRTREGDRVYRVP